MIRIKKDGGPKSRVWGIFFEIKRLFTVALLCFEDGTREAYHSHAFNSISLVLGPGHLEETFLPDEEGKARGDRIHKRGNIVITKRDDFHKVCSHGRTWVFTLRGPWTGIWKEYTDEDGVIELTFGRKIVNK